MNIRLTEGQDPEPVSYNLVDTVTGALLPTEGTVTWESDDTDVVSVEAVDDGRNALLTPEGPGFAVLTVSGQTPSKSNPEEMLDWERAYVVEVRPQASPADDSQYVPIPEVSQEHTVDEAGALTRTLSFHKTSATAAEDSLDEAVVGLLPDDVDTILGAYFTADAAIAEDASDYAVLELGILDDEAVHNTLMTLQTTTVANGGVGNIAQWVPVAFREITNLNLVAPLRPITFKLVQVGDGVAVPTGIVTILYTVRA